MFTTRYLLMRREQPVFLSVASTAIGVVAPTTKFGVAPIVKSAVYAPSISKTGGYTPQIVKTNVG